MSQMEQARVRKLEMAVKKIHRVYSNEMQNIIINLKDLKVYN